ncbi:hypothetical protein QR685DRAFT_222251 [Neurospora intermedia]|uniref:Uncharacterized protein n=1 Tax=Neurospora intermedia TaxID=5142 RepID=A0ABR3DH42_NEUIN
MLDEPKPRCFNFLSILHASLKISAIPSSPKHLNNEGLGSCLRSEPLDGLNLYDFMILQSVASSTYITYSKSRFDKPTDLGRWPNGVAVNCPPLLIRICHNHKKRPNGASYTHTCQLFQSIKGASHNSRKKSTTEGGAPLVTVKGHLGGPRSTGLFLLFFFFFSFSFFFFLLFIVTFRFIILGDMIEIVLSHFCEVSTKIEVGLVL